MSQGQAVLLSDDTKFTNNVNVAPINVPIPVAVPTYNWDQQWTYSGDQNNGPLAIANPEEFENVFALQLTHSDLPASALNLPGTQGRHDADASSGWYFPDGQSKPIILLLFKLKETEKC